MNDTANDPLLADIDAVESALDAAVDTLLSAAEAGEAALAGERVDLDRARAAFAEVSAACAFHDLTGQRLRRLREALAGAGDARPDAHLLNGPDNDGEGLDDAEVERLLAEGAEPSSHAFEPLIPAKAGTLALSAEGWSA